MRIALQVSLLCAIVAAIFPLTFLYMELPRAERGLRDVLQRDKERAAASLARDVEQWVKDSFESLSLVSKGLTFSEYGERELEQALLVAHKQVKGAQVVCLFDDQGNQRASPVHFEDPAKVGTPEYETAIREVLSQYASNVPINAAARAGRAVGPVYVINALEDGKPSARMVIASAVRGPESKIWILAVELSLNAVTRRLARVAEPAVAFVADNGAIVAHPDLGKLKADVSSHPLLAGRAAPSETLAAVADVPGLGWKVVLEEPATDALAPIRHLRQRAYLYLGVTLAVALLLGAGVGWALGRARRSAG